MEVDILELCKRVVENKGEIDGGGSMCSGIGCCEDECPFNNIQGGCSSLPKECLKIAQEYIDKHDPKLEHAFKIGDIVTGVNKSQWLSYGNYKIVKLATNASGQIYYGVESLDGKACYQGCIWQESDMKLSNIAEVKGEDKMKAKHTYKELISKWDNINQDDRYIGLGNNRGLTIYKDSDGGVAIEYEDGILGNEVLYIDIEDLFELQKPLTLDDFEIGEEFKVKDMDGRFMKVSLFDTILIARKYDNSFLVVTKTTEYLKDETLIKIKE